MRTQEGTFPDVSAHMHKECIMPKFWFCERDTFLNFFFYFIKLNVFIVILSLHYLSEHKNDLYIGQPAL